MPNFVLITAPEPGPLQSDYMIRLASKPIAAVKDSKELVDLIQLKPVAYIKSAMEFFFKDMHSKIYNDIQKARAAAAAADPPPASLPPAITLPPMWYRDP